VQPRSRRPGRTGAARGTHALTSTCTPGRTRQAPASFHLSSREAGKDFVQPRWHTHHQRAPCASELTMKLSCMVVAICSRDAVCLPLPSLAGLATKTPACHRAPPPSASRHPDSTKVNRRVWCGSNRSAFLHSRTLTLGRAFSWLRFFWHLVTTHIAPVRTRHSDLPLRSHQLVALQPHPDLTERSFVICTRAQSHDVTVVVCDTGQAAALRWYLGRYLPAAD
jgi:hypothetical protein